MPILRNRLNQLQAEANQTMAQAQALIAQASKAISVADKSLLQLVSGVAALTALATQLVAEVLDGIELEGEREVMGKAIPIKGRLKINFQEKETM